VPIQLDKHAAACQAHPVIAPAFSATVSQVCAALAASVAATSPQPLQVGPQPPKEYLCPISQQIMINPVVLIETGHSYEAANITRWLDTHSTCPMTGLQLHSKQLSSNRALRQLIAGWAATHGIALPAAPMYTPVLPVGPSPATMRTAQPHTAAAQAAAPRSMPHALLSVPHLARINSGSRDSPVADRQQQPDQQQQPDIDRSIVPRKPALLAAALAASNRSGSTSKQGMLRCTRTRWAAALLVLLVVLGVSIGAGVGVATMHNKGRTRAQLTSFGCSSGCCGRLGKPSLLPPQTNTLVTHSLIACIHAQVYEHSLSCMCLWPPVEPGLPARADDWCQARGIDRLASSCSLCAAAAPSGAATDPSLVSGGSVDGTNPSGNDSPVKGLLSSPPPAAGVPNGTIRSIVGNDTGQCLTPPATSGQVSGSSTRCPCMVWCSGRARVFNMLLLGPGVDNTSVIIDDHCDIIVTCKCVLIRLRRLSAAHRVSL
jgi:hypothetical protein